MDYQTGIQDRVVFIQNYLDHYTHSMGMVDHTTIVYHTMVYHIEGDCIKVYRTKVYHTKIDRMIVYNLIQDYLTLGVYHNIFHKDLYCRVNFQIYF